MNESNQIDLRKYREFGEMISTLIEFCKQNLKPLFGIYVRYGLSILVLGFVVGLLTNLSGRTSSNDVMIAVGGTGNLIFLLFTMAAMWALTAAIFGYVQGYVDRGAEYASATVSENFQMNLWAVLKVYLAVIFIVGLLGLLTFVLSEISGLGAVLLILLFLGFIYLWIKIILAPYICTQENFSLTEALGESYRLTDDKWWWAFGLYFVMSMIGSILTYVLMIPVMLIMFVPQFIGGADMDASSFGSTMLITNFVTYAGYMIYFNVLVLLMPFMYYSLSDFKYGTSIEERMDQPEGPTDSIFENEGDV